MTRTPLASGSCPFPRVSPRAVPSFPALCIWIPQTALTNAGGSSSCAPLRSLHATTTKAWSPDWIIVQAERSIGKLPKWSVGARAMVPNDERMARGWSPIPIRREESGGERLTPIVRLARAGTWQSSRQPPRRSQPTRSEFRIARVEALGIRGTRNGSMSP